MLLKWKLVERYKPRGILARGLLGETTEVRSEKGGSSEVVSYAHTQDKKSN